jgi:hypothetical protein
MQTVAEEKRKAYSCIIYSAAHLTKEKLKMLEELVSCSNDRDPDGLQGLEVYT